MIFYIQNIKKNFVFILVEKKQLKRFRMLASEQMKAMEFSESRMKLQPTHVRTDTDIPSQILVKVFFPFSLTSLIHSIVTWRWWPERNHFPVAVE